MFQCLCGIQINFCKNMDCSHFGRPASHVEQARGPGIVSSDGYILGSKKGQRVRLICKKCNTYSMLKSNQGIFEEITRLSAYLDVEPTVDCCPNQECKNSSIDVSAGKHFYQSFGRRRLEPKDIAANLVVKHSRSLRVQRFVREFPIRISRYINCL